MRTPDRLVCLEGIFHVNPRRLPVALRAVERSGVSVANAA